MSIFRVILCSVATPEALYGSVVKKVDVNARNEWEAGFRAESTNVGFRATNAEKLYA